MWSHPTILPWLDLLNDIRNDWKLHKFETAWRWEIENRSQHSLKWNEWSEYIYSSNEHKKIYVEDSDGSLSSGNYGKERTTFKNILQESLKKDLSLLQWLIIDSSLIEDAKVLNYSILFTYYIIVSQFWESRKQNKKYVNDE